MSILQAIKQISETLKKIYGEREAALIGELVIENITGSEKTKRIIFKDKELTTVQKGQLDKYLQRLLNHEPVQYVLNEAWFLGMKFYVDENVLIPRPETEEIVDWIITDCKFPISQLSILDIGCGSGCISISLKRKLRKAEVWGCDISEVALSVAKKNAKTLGAEINFKQLDFLNQNQRNGLPAFDIIVSNPPYIPEKNKEQMNLNVLNFEPATALFVPDNDPLIFYKVIADFGKKKLKENGSIYVEIHEDLAGEIISLFQSLAFSTELKKDLQGKDRMIRAVLPLRDS